MKKFALSLLLAAVCLMSGCGAEKVSAKEAPEAEAPVVTESDEVRQNLNFAFVCTNVAHEEYWGKAIKGAQDAAAEAGVTVTPMGETTFDNYVVKICEHMDDAIESNPDGIMAYCGVEGMNPLLEKAKSRGIPVLAVDSDAMNADDRIAYVGTDLAGMGRDSCKAIADVTTGTTKVGILWGSKSSANDITVCNAFKQMAQEYEIEILDERETDCDIPTAEAMTGDMLNQHPEITSIFTINSENATGAANYIKEHNLSDKITLVGSDDTPKNLEYTREDIINCLMVQQPYQMGYKGVKILKQYIDGGKNDLPKKKYYTGTFKVTSANIDNYDDASSVISSVSKSVKVGYYTGRGSYTVVSDREISSFQSMAKNGRKSGYGYDYYQAIATVAGWKYEYYMGDNGDRDEAVEMLIAGKVDIVAGLTEEEALRCKTEAGAHCSFNPMIVYNGISYYFVVAESRIDLYVDLKNAREEILGNDPFFESELLQKHYVYIGNNDISSDEELWLDAKHEIKVGYILDNMPISDRGEDGKSIGLVADLLVELEAYINRQITTDTIITAVAFNTATEMKEALISKDIDIIFPIYNDYWISESYGFKQSDVLFNDRLMILYSGKGEWDGDSNMLYKVASSPRAVGHMEYYQKFYPDAQVTYYSTIDDAIDAVKNGREKCIVNCASVLQRYLNYAEEELNLSIGYLETTVEFSMAVSFDDSVLVGILNKFINQLGPGMVTNSLMKHSAPDLNYSVLTFIMENILFVILFLVAVLIVIASVFVAYGTRARHFKREQNKSRIALEEALAVAEHASEAKTTFLSSMSHDIRTPMNSIVGMTAIAVNHIDDKERVKDCLQKITLSSNHLLTLINDVLDISKIESGKLALNPVTFSLRETVTNLANVVRPLVMEKNLDFRIHIIGMEHEYIYADAVRVNQIYMNLLTNAVKYTPEGGRVIMELAERLVDEQTVELTFIVEDTGIGMSEEFMKYMYDVFSRAQDSRINTIQGTGLGLSIVKQMVDMMKGTIECVSAPGTGTKFTTKLCFPVSKRDMARETLPAVKLLVVDDDVIFLESVRDIIMDMGASADVASSGRAAIEMVKEHKDEYAVVIVDWKMPDMSGLDTINEVRKIVGYELPIILVSAYDWEDIEDEASNCGANGFISKPLFRSYIAEKLYEVLKMDMGEKADVNDGNSVDITGLNLLVAEDNDLNWEVISMLLDMYGVTCEHAKNGKICCEMLEAAEDGKYDLVLMDIQMPVMDGKTATREIRKSEREYVRNIPVVAMTADAFAEDIAACMEAGMDAHLSKPVDMNKLCQVVSGIFKKRG